MWTAVLKWLSLHVLFGAIWIGTAMLLPDRPGETISFIWAFGGGAIFLFGPTVIAALRGWFN